MDTPAKESVRNQGSVVADPEREDLANDFYCRTCSEIGLKVASWEEFVAWQKFVDGHIGEAQLADEAKQDIEKLAKSFGKYVVIKKKETSEESQEEAAKKERVKHANKIYRKACNDAGVTVCFFHDFSSWSEYVNGKISDSEFYERAKAEIEQIAAKNSD